MTTVLIDGYALSDASHQRGIGTYVKRVIGGLASRPDLQVKVLSAAHGSLPDVAQRVPVRYRAPRRFRDREHELRLPGWLTKGEADVFHSPAQHPPRHCPLPWVQTLHDLTPLTWPHPLLEGERRWWLKTGPRLREAAAVIAVSRFSADEVIRRLDIDPRVVTVIPHGVDHAVFQPGDHAPTVDAYLLHVAAWGPHKGFAEAAAAIARLADEGLPHRLVLAGPNDDWMSQQIGAVVARSPRPDLVEIAGYVEDLASLYRGADALLVTSRCEGFGLPVLEAMACGTPVVAFDNSSLPEVVGDAGVLVPDGSIEGMVTAVRGLLADPPAREELVERGLARAAQFRWQDSIRSHAELILSVAG